MSYILRSLCRPSLHADKQDIVSVFCSSEDSEAGIVASLVIQLLQRNKNRAKATRTDFPITKFQQCGRGWDFTRLLWEVLGTSVKAAANFETVFIVDGIDALSPNIRSSFLDNFRMLEEKVAPRTMRVLISSKTEEDTKRALAHYSSIDREKERRECLKTLVFQEWNARESRVEDVKEGGKWLSSHPEYKQWSESSTPSALWLEGKPGSGKSTLAKLIVRKLENEGNGPTRKQSRVSNNGLQKGKRIWTINNPKDKSTIVARFYYSFRGGNTETNHELMLRSIVYQVWNKNSKLFPLLRDRYRELQKGIGDTREQKSLWTYDDLKWALESLHQIDFDLKVVIVVDGMDESDNDRRADVLNFLPGLASQDSRCIVKVLIASRPENDIISRLKHACSHHIPLQEVNKEDIRLVVDRWIERMESERNCGRDTFWTIKDYIMKYSSGVFLWVTLVLRDVEQCVVRGGYSKADLNKRVSGLPKELGGEDGFYRAMVVSLINNCKEDREQQERGRRILAWVTFPERPLSVTELQDILATPPQSERTNLSRYDLEHHRPLELDQGILSACGGLVEVRGPYSNRIVQLIHQTAREFLLDKSHVAKPYHLDEVRGDMEIAITCYRYIRIMFTTAIPQMEADAAFSQVERLARHLSGHRLLLYALVNFTTHLDHLGSNSKKVRLEFEDFITDLSKCRNSYACLLLWQWVETLNWPTKLHVGADGASTGLCAQSVLSCVAHIGGSGVVEVLLALRADILHLEAERGDMDITKLLLRMDADINAQDSGRRTPLYLAAENGHEAITQQLLEMGADVNAQDSGGRMPLHLAAENGHQAITKLLLDNGAATT